MTRHSERPSAHVEVIPAAREQEAILANLLELYAHDFSEFHGLGQRRMADSATVNFRSTGVILADTRFSSGWMAN
jgi:hypothetical protein